MTFTRTALLDDTQSVDQRVQYLLDNMTLEEKIGQIAGVWVTNLLDDNRKFAEEQARQHIQHGIGHITRISAASYLPPVESAKLANSIQRFLVEQTRLGIPAIVHEESCAGYMARGATTFPQSIGLAATWEPELVERMSEIIRKQMRVVGAHHALAPVLDVARDPRWGRIEETYGEDPFLISNIGLAYIKGLQSEDLSQGIVATGKHFAAHGIPEGGRNWGPVSVSKRELRETFITPFKAAVKEGKLASMMNAYHEWDGVPAGASYELMIDLLREELGFDGVVVSDYYTLKTLVDYHHVAHDKAEAARMGLEVGIDVELPFADCYGEPLRKALEANAIPIELVDTSVRRVLKMKFELGLFENPYVDEGAILEVYNTPDQIALSRSLAQKSIVLLKNDGLLPLKKDNGSIAVIGPHADSVRMLQGDYHYPAHMTHIFEELNSELAPMPQDQEGTRFDWSDHFPPTVTVLEAIKAAVSSATRVNYVQGCDVLEDDDSGFDKAIKVASESDVAILVVGDKSGLAVGNTIGESVDSAEIMLPEVQQKLIKAIHGTGTPVVLVLVTGRPYAITWEAENIPAIIEAWLPAQEGGSAIADVIFGDVNPAGKLPVTFPRGAGQIPAFYYHKPSGLNSNWNTDYRDMSVKPLYPFGHGLSYTKFEYSNLTLSSKEAKAEDVLKIGVTVKNTGERAGEEVVQLYLCDPVGTVTRPVKLLKGFKRVSLEPGESVTVTFAVDVRHMAFYDQRMNYIVEPGQIDVMIGSSSEDIRVQGSFQIVGQPTPVEQVFLTPVSIQ